ncbi:hypothetical protein JXB41_04110 [Candidatus Woesearchaeota archaeon]|nr:hypothetical protein [Candidatus Woesearchaeota archaeon]
MKRPVKIRHLVNWFHGNYCTRKCYEREELHNEHWPKLDELARKLEGTEMTHRDFLNMLRTDRTICTLSDDEWKNARFSWRHDDCPLCRMMGMR